MSTVAAGMESESDSDCDMVFSSSAPSSVKTSDYVPLSARNNTLASNVTLQSHSSVTNPENQDTDNQMNYNNKKLDMVPPQVIRRMKRNNIAYNRQRVHRNKLVVFDDLRYAISQGNLESTKNLYESNNIFVDTVLKSGWTGLMYACSYGHSEIVEYLLKQEANPNFHKDMFTPLMAVCISKKNEISLLKCCHLLLKYNANVNVHDRHRTTPLMFAARESHTEIVRLLLDHAAEPNAADSRGYTALAWAAFFGHGQVVRILLEKGADKRIANNMGQLPADIAYDQGYNEVSSLLQNIQTLDSEEPLETEKASVANNTDKKIVPNSNSIRTSENSNKFNKLGELELFLIGIGCHDLVQKFHEHHLSFHDLLIMDDAELEKIGIFQVGLRKKILEASKAVHKKKWEDSSLPNLKKNLYISCPDAVAMLANISKHLKYISTSVVYIRNQIQSQPRILELSKESANVHDLMDELEDSLKNLQTLKDEMKFLKMHLVKVEDKPEYSSCDLIVETISKEDTHKKLYTAIGIATVSVILAGIWWKYPSVLDTPPMILIRIPFLKS